MNASTISNSGCSVMRPSECKSVWGGRQLAQGNASNGPPKALVAGVEMGFSHSPSGLVATSESARGPATRPGWELLQVHQPTLRKITMLIRRRSGWMTAVYSDSRYRAKALIRPSVSERMRVEKFMPDCASRRTK